MNQPQHHQQQNGLLVSLDTPESNGHYEESKSSSLPSGKKFLFKNSDIIFENDVLQIGIKGETTKNSMHIELYYGNKTNFNLTNFSVHIGDLESGKLISFLSL